MLTGLPILAFILLFIGNPSFYLDVADDPAFLPGYVGLLILYVIGFYLDPSHDRFEGVGAMTEILANDAGSDRPAAPVVLGGRGGRLRRLQSHLANGARFGERLTGSSARRWNPKASRLAQGFEFMMRAGAWVALVTAIEKAGIPLVDTKDATSAAGWSPRAISRNMRRASIR